MHGLRGRARSVQGLGVWGWSGGWGVTDGIWHSLPFHYDGHMAAARKALAWNVSRLEGKAQINS